MAVSLKAFTQMEIDWGGFITLSWPGTAAAGDLAVVFCQDGHQHPADTTGWTPVYGSSHCTTWSKILTSADLASDLDVKAELTGILIVSNGAGLGVHRDYPGCRVASDGSGIFVFGEQDVPATTIDPSADQVGDPVISPGWGVNQLWFKLAPYGGTYYRLVGTDDDADYQCWEIRPIIGPREPILTGPEAGAELDSSLSVLFSWLHQSTADQVQEQAKVRVRQWTYDGSGTWYYLTAAGGWTTTDTTLSQSAESATLSAGNTSANTLYEWTVSTYDTGTWSPYAPVQQFIQRAHPTVDSVSVSSPAGSLTPVVSWTRTIGYGTQQAYQVRISPASGSVDVPLWDSQVKSGSALTVQAPATAGWTNGEALHAWVRVMQTGGLWSDWEQTAASWQVTWTPPTAPSGVSLAAQSGSPLELTVTGIPADMAGLQVETSDDGGVTWAAAPPIEFPSTSETIPLPLAEYGVEVLARARVWVVESTVSLYSSWATTGTGVAATWRGSCLVSSDGAEWLAVQIVGDSDKAREVVQGVTVTRGLGSSRPRVDRTVTQGEAGSLVLGAESATVRAALLAWVTGRASWYLRWPAEVQDGAGWVSGGVTLMTLAAAASHVRVTGRAAFRRIEFDWVEQ